MNEAPLRSIALELGIEVAERSRGWVTAPCPFAHWTHKSGQDRRPSFGMKVNDEGVSAFKCHSCKLHGRISSLVRLLGEYRNTRYPELAIRADRADMEISFGDFESLAIETRPLVPLIEEAYRDIYPLASSDHYAVDYLILRGLTVVDAGRLGLLFDIEQRRILFPVRDQSGDLYGFTGRTIDSGVQPKVRDYYGLPKRHLLLGIEHVREGLPLIVVEGLFGYAHLFLRRRNDFDVVALLGSELTPEKAQLIIDLNRWTILLLDNDDGGDIGLFGVPLPSGERSGGAVDRLKGHVPLHVPVWPEGKEDPDELTRDDIAEILQGRELY